MDLKQAKKFAEPYLGQPGTVTVTIDENNCRAVYVGNSVEEMEAICKEKNWQLFVIRVESTKKLVEPIAAESIEEVFKQTKKATKKK